MTGRYGKYCCRDEAKHILGVSKQRVFMLVESGQLREVYVHSVGVPLLIREEVLAHKQSRDERSLNKGPSKPRTAKQRIAGLAVTANNRAKAAGQKDRLTTAEIMRLFEQQKGLCTYCNEHFGMGLGIDHIVPLSVGGSNHISNIAGCCTDCNRKKNAKWPYQKKKHTKIVKRA